MIGRSGKISNPDMYVVSAFDCFNLGSDLNFNGGYRKLDKPQSMNGYFFVVKRSISICYISDAYIEPCVCNVSYFDLNARISYLCPNSPKIYKWNRPLSVC